VPDRNRNRGDFTLKAPVGIVFAVALAEGVLDQPIDKAAIRRQRRLFIVAADQQLDQLFALGRRAEREVRAPDGGHEQG